MTQKIETPTIIYTSNISTDVEENFLELCQHFLNNYRVQKVSQISNVREICRKKSALIILGDGKKGIAEIKKTSINHSLFSFCFHINEHEEIESEGFKHIHHKKMIIDLISAIKNNIPPLVDNDNFKFLPIDTARIKKLKEYPCDLYMRIN